MVDAKERGPAAALKALNLEALAGRPVEEIFLGLADFVCPERGSVDSGVARDAWIETIADLTEAGITNLDGLTAEQIQTVFELYATHAIEARICNDIGKNAITFPKDVRAAENTQAQLRDFIARGVADALTAAHEALVKLTLDRVLGFVDEVYEAAFGILQALGEAEDEAA